jgi:hypothetical protein
MQRPFLEFWRQHGELLLKSSPYHEIPPHLVLMAFLHRVVNGSGTLEREYAIGSGRMDICLRYGKVVMGIELKVRREKLDPLTKGLTQLDKYLDGLGLDTGSLVIFDRRPGLPPMGERISIEEAFSPGGRIITVIRAQWAQLLITSSLWAIALFKNSHIPSHTRKPPPHIAKSLIGKFIKNFVKNSLQI